MDDLLNQAARLLGIDRATLERMARDLDKSNPELRQYFDKNVADEGFDNAMSELEDELKEVLKHVRSPSVDSRSRN